MTAPQRRRRGRWLGAVAAVSACLAAAQLYALWKMDYSTSSLETMSPATARAASDPYRLGSLSWDLATYRAAPQLELLRRLVAQNCAGRGPVETAACLADLFAARFDHGAPHNDLFDSRYDPAEDLRVHLAGEVGHCVTRSGLITTALLASGMLARMVQLNPGDAGHNVVEVWNGHGWTVIDPTYGALLAVAPDGEHSAVAALNAPQHVRWVRDGMTRPAAIAALSPTVADAGVRHAFDTVVVYPEPWLYTRVGPRVATWPMRGRFVVIGAASWNRGIGQTTLRWGTVACAAVFGFALAIAVTERWRQRSKTDAVRAATA